MKHASISYLRSLAYNAPRREDREHFTAVADEIERLRYWKLQATEVLKRWDAVYEMVPEPNENVGLYQSLGSHKSDAVAAEIERLRNAGNSLERELMKLHRNYHGPDCDTCQALIRWWEVNGR